MTNYAPNVAMSQVRLDDSVLPTFVGWMLIAVMAKTPETIGEDAAFLPT